MEDKFKKGISGFFDILGEILAFLTILVYAIFVINANWEFITNEQWLNFLSLARFYAPLALVCIVGMEFAVKRSFLVQLIIYVLIAGIIIFQFFPGTWDSIIGAVGV